jgi:[ribosomal protein S18]-alanine N-acetyltransferase
VRVRPAELSDLDEITALERVSFANPWPRSAFWQELRLPYARLGVAEDADGRLAGFVDSWLRQDELHLLVLAVRPPLRRAGVGAALVDGAEEHARERSASYAILEVRAANGVARAFYNALGYHHVGVKRGYYSDNGEDALVLMKYL